MGSFPLGAVGLLLPIDAVGENPMVSATGYFRPVVSAGPGGSREHIRRLDCTPMNAKKLLMGAALATLTVCAARATGVADTDISQGVDNVNATWTAVKAVMIPIGIFLVAWGFFKRLKRA